MNSKTAKMIRKYARLRGNDQNAFGYKNLVRTFNQASPKQQEEYKTEMVAYFKAIDEGTIKQGEPIFYQTINKETERQSNESNAINSN